MSYEGTAFDVRLLNNKTLTQEPIDPQFKFSDFKHGLISKYILTHLTQSELN